MGIRAQQGTLYAQGLQNSTDTVSDLSIFFFLFFFFFFFTVKLK